MHGGNAAIRELKECIIGTPGVGDRLRDDSV
jgi:hypothetical protein